MSLTHLVYFARFMYAALVLVYIRNAVTYLVTCECLGRLLEIV